MWETLRSQGLVRGDRPFSIAPSRGCGRSRKSLSEAGPRAPINLAANRPMVAWGVSLAGILARRGRQCAGWGGSLLRAIADREQAGHPAPSAGLGVGNLSSDLVKNEGCT